MFPASSGPLPATLAELTARTGPTPLAPLEIRLGPDNWTVLLKLEGHNPLGSIKDRTAASLLQSVQAAFPDDRPLSIIESTSGNLGAALAALCRLRGHTFTAVVDPKVSRHNLAIMEHFGAWIELVDDPGRDGSHLAARIARVRRIRAARPWTQWTDQYTNPANPRVHFEQTGPEILRQAGPDVDSVFVAASTGGTLAGIASHIRAADPSRRIHVVGVDAAGSVALGGRPSPRRLTGYGASSPSAFVDAALLDAVVHVTDADAIATCHKLAEETGLYLGGSSGAVIAACVRYLTAHPQLRKPVCVCPDYGEKYLDSLYDQAWIREHTVDVQWALRTYRHLDLGFRTTWIG